MTYDEFINHIYANVSIYENSHNKNADYVIMNGNDFLILQSGAENHYGLSKTQSVNARHTVMGIKIMIDDELPDGFIKVVGD